MSKIIYVNNIPVTIEYRKVKNINLYIKPPEAQVLITAPPHASERRIRDFAKGKAQWIEKSRKRMLDSLEGRAEETSRSITDAQLGRLVDKVEEYARIWEPVMGVNATNWTFRYMKTRWGSCSARGNLNFHWKLILMPPEVLDYVVVHELAHRREMNHSSRFWAEVERIMPDYKRRRKWLKENGGQV